MIKLKKVFSLLALVVFLVSLSSSNSTQTELKEKQQTVEGELEGIVNANNGKMVLINFWASYDAKSRVENIRIAQVINNHKKQHALASELNMITVSFDKFKSVYTETLKRDNLQEVTQLHLRDGFSSTIAKDLKLKHKFGNVLLNEKGVIIARNFSSEELKRILERI